ncbi:MAG: hypothetical protein GVY16_10500 [Planctomycetes bacterium]|jgi:preprotein translocase subunit SecA|nr:hypothetical protein [Phycisphaerae bacterium]NBB96152.1 hypothetical protein [Planctomycetota bacterium]
MTVVPSTIWRTLAGRTGSDSLPQGLDAIWDVASGFLARLVPRRRRYLQRAQRVVALQDMYAEMTDAALRDVIADLWERYRCGRDEAADLVTAFAVVCEVAFRKLGERTHPVQLAGAFALTDGCIAEMATGEGKTLAAVFPAIIAGWRGKGCHVITVNDYLAQRDAEWMAPVYKMCNCRVASVVGEMQPPDRRNSYLADVTYLTNKEAAADFLRDRLALGRLDNLPSAICQRIVAGQGRGTDRLVQRGLHCAIIDEADSVMIDEAVTPLIISGEAPNPEQVEAFTQAGQLADGLDESRDFKVDRRRRDIELTSAGKRRLAELAGGLGGIWAGARRREELVTQALTARLFYLRDKQYVVQEDQIVIVDDSTGRLMPDREWRDGLHQAVSAKEQVEVQAPKDTYARISFQRFFRLYRKLSGMTGTAKEASREFWQIYHLPVVVVPTHKPCIRRQLPGRVFSSAQAKWQAVAEEIQRIHATNQPVLVGTRSVRASEHLSRMLAERGLEHQVLNAVQHEKEAQIVAEAGKKGRITVATNMAGRGTNIRLGRGVEELGGLYVISTERNDASRIDRQLYGRSARQGEPGMAQYFASLEDELLERHRPHMARLLRKRYGSDREISNTVTRKQFNRAQARAQKQALQQRKGVLRTDDWLDEYLGFAGVER